VRKSSTSAATMHHLLSPSNGQSTQGCFGTVAKEG
jgi:hypothetical protein